MRIPRRSCIAVVAGALGFGAHESRAAGAIDGTYAGTSVFGPILLDGRYPFTVGMSSPGMLDVSTSAAGVLDARVTFAAQTEDAVGKLVSTPKGIKLALRGKVDEGRIALSATLQGSALVGTVKLLGTTQPCRIEISSVGPLRADYALALRSTSRGRITGAGTVTVGLEAIPVRVRGSARKGRLSLTVSGGNTRLKLTSGEISDGLLSSRTWTARGFGTRTSAGRPVRLVRIP